MHASSSVPAKGIKAEPADGPTKVSTKPKLSTSKKKLSGLPKRRRAEQATKPSAKATKKMGLTPSGPESQSKAPLPSPKTPSAKAVKATSTRAQKIKMVRDSFTFPEAEHKRLVEMKKRLIALGAESKKGELVRAGLELLSALDNNSLLKAVAGVEKLKTGRPKK